MGKKIIAPQSFGAYLQSGRTALGFDKMRRRGIVPPPFQVEQMAARMMRNELDALVALMSKQVIRVSASTGEGVKDDDLLEETRKRIKTQLAELNARGDLSEDEERIRFQLQRQLAEAQESFFKDFFEDASERMKTRIAFSLDKDEVFRDRLAGIRKNYLESAVERIHEGQYALRKRFIGLMEQWITGEREDLDTFDDLVGKISKEAGNFSKFFARDQFSRFNRALMIASYDEAGAKWIRWATVGDGRVRKAHRNLNGKIFAIDDMPKEYLDYNCRCGYLPIFELTQSMYVTPGDGVRLAA